MTKIPEKMISVTAYALREAPNCSYETLASLALEAAWVGELIYAIKDAQRRLSGAGMLGGDDDCVNAAYLKATTEDARAAHPDADEQRQLHRASVEAGYASLQSYVERYGKGAK